MHRRRHRCADAVTGADTLLTIATGLRTPPRADTIEIVDGLRTHTIPQITKQKITAFQMRTTGRDLLDLAFLITHYAGLLAPVHDHHHHWHGDDRYPPCGTRLHDTEAPHPDPLRVVALIVSSGIRGVFGPIRH